MLSVRPWAVNTGRALHGGGVGTTGQLGLPGVTFYCIVFLMVMDQFLSGDLLFIIVGTV